jgi:hypothetical protein
MTCCSEALVITASPHGVLYSGNHYRRLHGRRNHFLFHLSFSGQLSPSVWPIVLPDHVLAPSRLPSRPHKGLNSILSHYTSLSLQFGPPSHLPLAWPVTLSLSRYTSLYMRFQVLPAASMMFRVVFWDILPCKIIVDRRFRGAYMAVYPRRQLWTLSVVLLNCAKNMCLWSVCSSTNIFYVQFLSASILDNTGIFKFMHEVLYICDSTSKTSI